MNNLTAIANLFLSKKDSVLDLCCGNGETSKHLNYSQITGVDIYQPYLNEYKIQVPNSEVINLDIAKLVTENIFHDHSFDSVICLDGVEHFDEQTSQCLISKLESIAKKRLIIFTPLNLTNYGEIVLNHPKNAWGIADGDCWQEHKCGYAPQYFESRGFLAFDGYISKNIYDGTYYQEMLYVKEISLR